MQRRFWGENLRFSDVPVAAPSVLIKWFRTVPLGPTSGSNFVEGTSRSRHTYQTAMVSISYDLIPISHHGSTWKLFATTYNCLFCWFWLLARENKLFELISNCYIHRKVSSYHFPSVIIGSKDCFLLIYRLISAQRTSKVSKFIYTDTPTFTNDFQRQEIHKHNITRGLNNSFIVKKPSDDSYMGPL